MKNRTKRRLLIFLIIGVGLMITMMGYIFLNYTHNKKNHRNTTEETTTERATSEAATTETTVYKLEIEPATQVASTETVTTEINTKESSTEMASSENTTEQQTSEEEPAEKEQKKKVTKKATILVGDSRFLIIKDNTKMTKEKDIYMVAKEDAGYDWLKNTAIKEIEELKEKHKNVTEWNIVFYLGVNDLQNQKKYADFYLKYDEQYDNDNIILCSVTQVEEPSEISDNNIQEFNNAIYETGFSYIDIYYELATNGYKTTDGVNYDAETSKKIYTIIQGFLDYFK